MPAQVVHLQRGRSQHVRQSGSHPSEHGNWPQVFRSRRYRLKARVFAGFCLFACLFFKYTFNKYLSTMSSLQLAHTALPNSGAEAIACSDGASPSKTSTDAPWSWRNECKKQNNKQQTKHTHFRTHPHQQQRKKKNTQQHKTLKEVVEFCPLNVSSDSRFSGST